MTHSKKYMISVALIVAFGGFLMGFDASVISGTSTGLNQGRAEPCPGLEGTLNFGLPAMATLILVLFAYLKQSTSLWKNGIKLARSQTMLEETL